jgi:hypothetical protein
VGGAFAAHVDVRWRIAHAGADVNDSVW